MLTLENRCESHEEIRKSRFHTLASPVADVTEAMAFFAKHGDPLATHNCWAYRVGQAYRFNDDGEPTGTAGKPILQAIDGLGCDRVAVLVIRWFGGIKLGAGGLMRAYGGCAAQCLRQATLCEIVPMAKVHCECAFGDMARIRPRIYQAGAHITAEQFGERGVIWELEVPVATSQALEVTIADISRGQARWEPVAGE